MLGVLDEDDEKLEVPIDQIIIEEIRKLGIEVPNGMWSKWDNIAEYKKLQDCLYEYLSNEGYSRIEWENKRWIDGVCNLR